MTKSSHLASARPSKKRKLEEISQDPNDDQQSEARRSLKRLKLNVEGDSEGVVRKSSKITDFFFGERSQAPAQDPSPEPNLQPETPSDSEPQDLQPRDERQPSQDNAQDTIQDYAQDTTQDRHEEPEMREAALEDDADSEVAQNSQIPSQDPIETHQQAVEEQFDFDDGRVPSDAEDDEIETSEQFQRAAEKALLALAGDDDEDGEDAPRDE